MFTAERYYQRLSREWGMQLEVVNVASNLPYFWDERVGYDVEDQFTSNLTNSDLSIINYYKQQVKYPKTTTKILNNYKVDILMTRDKKQYSLNTVFTLGCLLTNFFQSMPADDDNEEINNPLFVPGEIKCRNENGVYFLKKYGNIREGLLDAAEFFHLAGSDSDDLTILHKFHNFSLTAYRLYFPLCMMFLKGGEWYDRNCRVSRSGNSISPRRNVSNAKREEFWGADISSHKRPAGRTWREDS